MANRFESYRQNASLSGDASQRVVKVWMERQRRDQLPKKVRRAIARRERKEFKRELNERVVIEFEKSLNSVMHGEPTLHDVALIARVARYSAREVVVQPGEVFHFELSPKIS